MRPFLPTLIAILLLTDHAPAQQRAGVGRVGASVGVGARTRDEATRAVLANGVERERARVPQPAE